MYNSKPAQDLFLFTNIHFYNEKNINCFLIQYQQFFSFGYFPLLLVAFGGIF